MATGKTNTIIIRDETKGGSSKSNNVTRKDFDNNGALKPKRNVTGNKRTGRPRTGKSAEPNRYQRLYNSTLNKLTGGRWERGNRFFRAAESFTQFSSDVGATIIGKFVVDKVIDVVLETTRYLTRDAEEKNSKDILRIRTGDMAIGSNYKISTNFFTGRVTYKSNR